MMILRRKQVKFRGRKKVNFSKTKHIFYQEKKNKIATKRQFFPKKGWFCVEKKSNFVEEKGKFFQRQNIYFTKKKNNKKMRDYIEWNADLPKEKVTFYGEKKRPNCVEQMTKFVEKNLILPPKTNTSNTYNFLKSTN